MSDVTGQIIGSDGTKDVRLNNAATEATLRSLLNTANVDSAVLREIARQAGVDQVTLDNLSIQATASASSIQRATVSTEQLTVSQNRLREHNQLVDSSFAGIIDSARLLASGNATVSGVLEAFKGLPGPLGLVIQGFAALAAFQETNMKTYQTMSSAGANFGGSLTDMRLAAQGTFVTLEQFGNLVKNNSQVLGRMGGSVDEGTRAFAAMSNSLLTSQAGEKLLSLGYTTEDVNQGMLSYIATTGGRTKEEMKNTQAITAATTEYMSELDKLTQFTGVNRKKLEEDQKKAQEQAAFQRKLATMSEEERAKTMAAYNAASASGLKGATDLVMSTALGLPPVTEEARHLSGILPDAANGIVNMTNTAMTAGSTMEDVNKGFGRVVEGAQRNTEAIGVTGDALSLMGTKAGEVIGSGITLSNQMNAKGVKTADDVAKQMMDIQNKQVTQAASQAATMAKAEIQLKEFGLAIMKLISPIISVLTPVLSYLGPLLLGLAAAVLVVKTAMLAREFLGGGAAAAGGVGRRIAGAALGGGGAARAAGTAGALVPGAAAAPGGGILGGVLGSLASGLQKMGNPQVLLGIVAVGLLGGAMMVAGKAFKEFTGVNWGDVLIGSVVLTALSIGASALVGIAPFIATTAVAIGLLGGAIWLLAKGLKEFPTFAIPGMSEAFEGFGKIVGTVFGFVGDIVTGLIDTIKTVFGTIWDVISWPFKQIGNLISGTVEVVTGMFGTLWDIISWPFKQLGNLISGTVNVVTGMFGVLWDVVSWPFKQLGNLISGTVDVVTGMFGILWNIVSWPFKQLGNLISGTIDVVTGLFGILWDVISWPFKQLGNLISGTVGVIGDILGGMVDIVKGIFGIVWDVISWPFKQLGNLISGTVGVIGDILGGMVDIVTGIFGAVWNVISWPFKQLGNLISGTVGVIGDILGGMVDIVTGIFGAVWNVISWPFKQLGNLISGTINIVTGILNGIVNIVTGIFGAVWNVISWPFKQLGNIVSGIADVIAGAFNGMINGISETFSKIWGVISSPFTSVGNLVSGTADAITGAFGGMVDGISNVFGSVRDIISSPFTMIGDLASSAVDGITGAFSGIVDGISGIFGSVWDAISSPFNMVGNLVSSTVDSIIGVFNGIVDSISSAFGTVWDIMSTPFNMIGDLVSSVFDGISSAISFVVDKLTNILGMIGSVIEGIAGFVGDLFGGGDEDKEGSGSGSPEFAKATSTLLEAANKLGSVSDKLATVNLGPRQEALPGSTAFDSIFKMALTASSVKKETAGLPPLSEEAKKLSANIFGEKGPSLEEKTHTELVSLNTTMKDLLRYIKDTADNTKKTHEATKKLNGNAFAI